MSNAQGQAPGVGLSRERLLRKRVESVGMAGGHEVVLIEESGEGILPFLEMMDRVDEA